MTTAAPATNLATLLEASAQRTPDATAIEDPQGCRLTYRELDEAASRLAHRLVEMGVRQGDRVGLCLPKSINSVISIFGALKARAAYVPTDHSSPPERNRYIFDNCQTRVVCGDEPRAASLGEAGFERPLLVFPGDSVGAPWLKEGSPTFRHEEPPDPADLSYILYTSGSTGVPKGVMHTHASASSFVLWAAETFRPRPDDRFSSHAPFHFDLSILDLYVPMTAGAAIVLVDDALGKEPQALAKYIADRAITVWYSVPSILALLAQYGRLESFDYSRLRTVLFAGEVFPIKHLRALKDKWPDSAYFNLYGPTETNVCTFYLIPDVIEPDRQTPYPIGRPCSNCEAVVLDDGGRPVSGADEGVLHIHASGPVMTGYWGLDDRTRTVFHTDGDGRPWYCTGDVVSLDDDGNYLFVGRRDRMVKRRGYRIELGEIEAGLYRHPDVREAAAVAKEDEEGVSVIVFLSAKGDARLSIIALKQFCMRHLPSYMVPDRFVFLDEMPRTSTDKVDYQGLSKSV